MEEARQMQDAGYARGDVLVDPPWLEEHLDDPALRLIEVDVNSTAYDGGHLPGAVLWNICRDLKDGNYSLVDAAAIEKLVVRSGIAPESTVVFYGYAPAMGFWLMNLYAHDDVRILDCSRAFWPPSLTCAPTLNSGGRPSGRRGDPVLHRRRPGVHRVVRTQLPAQPRPGPDL